MQNCYYIAPSERVKWKWKIWSFSGCHYQLCFASSHYSSTIAGSWKTVEIILERVKSFTVGRIGRIMICIDKNRSTRKRLCTRFFTRVYFLYWNLYLVPFFYKTVSVLSIINAFITTLHFSAKLFYISLYLCCFPWSGKSYYQNYPLKTTVHNNKTLQGLRII